MFFVKLSHENVGHFTIRPLLLFDINLYSIVAYLDVHPSSQVGNYHTKTIDNSVVQEIPKFLTSIVLQLTNSDVLANTMSFFRLEQTSP